MLKTVLLGATILGLLTCAGPKASAALVTFQLGTPTTSGNAASLDVSFLFALEAGETAGELDTIGLSLLGSDAALTGLAGDDFSRFSFDVDTSFATWNDGGLTIDQVGYVILFAGNPIAPGTYTLGTLTVDISGLSEASVLVRINGGGSDPGDDNTFFAGTIDGDAGTVNFEGIPQFAPGEQTIDVAPVPEPGTFAIFAIVGACSLLGLRRPKRRIV